MWMALVADVGPWRTAEAADFKDRRTNAGPALAVNMGKDKNQAR
jgi:uncharacterized protein YfaP (DUF2135 family)